MKTQQHTIDSRTGELMMTKMQSRYRFLFTTLSLVLSLLLTSSLPVWAQPGSLDASFTQAGTGFNTFVFDLALQTDGKVIVGGAFFQYNGTTQNYVTRLNTDGTLDAAFAPTGTGLNNTVISLAVQTDGKILVGGSFTSYNGTTRNYIARLNADGTLDATFAPTGTGLNGGVTTLILQADGKVLVGGGFTDYNGTTRNRIARLNADGTLDATFVPTGTGLSGQVQKIVLQADGKVLVVGAFTDYNGTARNRIARLNADGTLDATFDQTGTGVNNQVDVLALQTDGKILVGGVFTSYNGTARNRILRLNTDGTLDATFVQTGTGLNGQVVSLALQSDGRVFAGGLFTSYNGNSRSRLVRLFTTIPPTITSFFPPFGAPGSTVTIIGTGFTGATAVNFGGVPAASFTVNSDTQITAVLGGGVLVTGGQQLVAVTSPAGSGTRGGFFVGSSGSASASVATSAPQSAVLSGISPSSIGFGTPITITGSGFTGATGLLIGGVPVTNFIVVNDNTITAVVGGVPVNDRVQLVGGLGANLTMGGLGLTYNALPAPTLTTINPTSIAASGDDATLTLAGTNFRTGARVLVREASADPNTASVVATSGLTATQVTATLPGNLRGLGTKTVTVINADGQSASINLNVTIGASIALSASSQAVITTTASGRAFSVALSGANIFRTVRATLNGAPALVSVPSSTQAIVEIPASLNVFGGITLALLLTNTDGQSTTATVRIERRSPPTILTVTLQSGGVLRVGGVNFQAGMTSTLGNSSLAVLSQSGNGEFTAQIPSTFRLMGGSPTVTLLVQNPDGASHGVVLPRSLFEAASAGISSVHGVSTERTWEAGSVAELVEVQAVKQAQGGVQELSIYPNPVEGELRIGGTDVRTVRLYDMRGVVVLEERTVSGVVNVSSLPTGSYTVVVEATNGRIVQQRVMKK